MKLKKSVNKILKEYHSKEISISKKSITLIEEYLLKFLKFIKEDITFYDKLYKNKKLWTKSRKRIQEIFDDENITSNSHKKIKIKNLK